MASALVEPQECTVKLITATRLPARQAHLVRARVEGVGDVLVTLLQPARKLRERGLVIEEAALAPDDEHCVSIPIQNFSHEPLHLETGEVLVRYSLLLFLPIQSFWLKSPLSLKRLCLTKMMFQKKIMVILL